MNEYNLDNEKIKRTYFRYLKGAGGKSSNTIDKVRLAIHEFEKFTKFADFRKFYDKQAEDFKEYLAAKPTRHGNGTLSKSTQFHTVKALRNFFKWLTDKPGYYKLRKRLDDIDYLKLSLKDERIAKGTASIDFPTLEQIRAVIFSMPSSNDIEKRNRALIAIAILTGARINALISLRLKHIDIDRELVRQNPAEVKTKFSKAIDTYFFPVGDDIKAIFIDWYKYLIETKLYGNNDPLFPRTKLSLDKNQSYCSDGLEKEFWQTTQPAREIFKQAFENAGLSYYNPHSFRRTLVHFCEMVCKTPAEFKAVAQNLGHENVSTTFSSYGYIDPCRQGELIKNLEQKTKE